MLILRRGRHRLTLLGMLTIRVRRLSGWDPLRARFGASTKPFPRDRALVHYATKFYIRQPHHMTNLRTTRAANEASPHDANAIVANQVLSTVSLFYDHKMIRHETINLSTPSIFFKYCSLRFKL